MDDKTSQPPEQRSTQDTKRLLYVMLVVLIICGGNGAGILTAALIWKSTGHIPAAVFAVVFITLLAFIAAMLVVLFHNKKRN